MSAVIPVKIQCRLPAGLVRFLLPSVLLSELAPV